jgi:lysine/ornithine N-monooxygenase
MMARNMLLCADERRIAHTIEYTRRPSVFVSTCEAPLNVSVLSPNFTQIFSRAVHDERSTIVLHESLEIKNFKPTVVRASEADRFLPFYSRRIIARCFLRTESATLIIAAHRRRQ